jgi:hypothetical protein
MSALSRCAGELTLIAAPPARSEWFDAMNTYPAASGRYEFLTASDGMLHLMAFDAHIGRWGRVGSMDGSGELLFLYSPFAGDVWRGLPAG